MKKFICTLTTFALCATMSVPAFAATTDTMTDKGSKDIDVKAVYSDEVTVPTVYNVDLEWGKMEFTYTVTGTKQWNPSTNQYDLSTNVAWTEVGNDITVTNHSNAAVTANLAFAPLTAYSTVTGNFSNDSVSLAAADKKNVTETELTATSALTLGGTLDKSVDTLTNVGKITVTIE